MNTLLLDRDGVLIAERHYDYTPDNISLLPGVVEGLKMLAGRFAFYVVSNQSAVSRGYYTATDVEAVHAALRSLLAKEGISVADIVFCPHHPDDHCPCRKPKIGMWEDLALRHGLNKKDAVMVGNRPSDITFGRAIGCFSVLVNDPVHAAEQALASPDLRVHDLRELAAFLLFSEPWRAAS